LILSNIDKLLVYEQWLLLVVSLAELVNEVSNVVWKMLRRIRQHGRTLLILSSI
jgi:hypothetical protein